MTSVAIIQARTGSTRLPGKVLADLGGVPLLDFMLRRVLPAPVDDVVVATTVDPRDDPIAGIAAAAGIRCFRGPEEDVLERFLLALDSGPADTVVRLTADCPLADPALIGEALAVHRSQDADYTSNTIVRTYPDGLDVEVVRADVLREAASEAVDQVEREHVTPFVYRRPERYRLGFFRLDRDLSSERWTVDTSDDLAFVRRVVSMFEDDTRFRWTDVLDRVGISGPPTGLVQLHVADDSRPEARAWVAGVDGRVVGAARLMVKTGRGILSVDADVEHRRSVEDAALALLAHDLQLVEIVTRQPDPT